MQPPDNPHRKDESINNTHLSWKRQEKFNGTGNADCNNQSVRDGRTRWDRIACATRRKKELDE
jgi:hypothetical protein